VLEAGPLPARKVVEHAQQIARGLAAAHITPWKMLRPDDLTGATHVVALALTADGEAYAYTYGRYFQDLYLVEGLRP